MDKTLSKVQYLFCTHLRPIIIIFIIGLRYSQIAAACQLAVLCCAIYNNHWILQAMGSSVTDTFISSVAAQEVASWPIRMSKW